MNRIGLWKLHSGIIVFLLITFGLAWTNWIVLIASGIRPPSGLKFVFGILPGSFAPAIAGFVVRKWIAREGFADAGLRLNWHRSWRYLLFGSVRRNLVFRS